MHEQDDRVEDFHDALQNPRAGPSSTTAIAEVATVTESQPPLSAAAPLITPSVPLQHLTPDMQQSDHGLHPPDRTAPTLPLPESDPRDPAQHAQSALPAGVVDAVGMQDEVSKDGVAAAKPDAKADVLPPDTIVERPVEPPSEAVLEAAFQVRTAFVSVSTGFIMTSVLTIDSSRSLFHGPG